MSTVLHPPMPGRRPEIELWGHQEWFRVLGAVLMLLGLTGIGAMLAAALADPFFVGWLMLAGGLVNLFNGCRLWGRPWPGVLPSVVVGLAYTAAGTLAMANPAGGAAALTMLLSASMVPAGVLRALAAVAGWAPARAWTLASGLVTLAIGTLVRLEPPESGPWIPGVLVGVDLLVGGWAFVAAASANHAPPSALPHDEGAPA